MWLRHSLLLLSIAAAFLFSIGCGGYRFAADEPLVLPEGSRLLAMEEIDNPTMETWLSPQLRSLIRDEVASRGDVTWTSKADADSLLTVRVLRYTESARIKDDLERTLKKMVEIRIEATLTSTADETVLWDSGPVIAHETFLADGELSAARSRAVQMAVRELVDRLGHAF